jgi:4-hydroxybenzoate polyprenyltransferase
MIYPSLKKFPVKFRAVLQIIRFLTPLYAFAGVVVASWLAYQEVAWPSRDVLFGGLMMFCVFSFGNCTNDLLDRDTDSFSNPSRPLLNGSLTTNDVVILAIVLGGLTLIFGGLTGWRYVIVGIFGLLLVSVYNLWLKRVLYLSNLSIGLWAVLPAILVPFTDGIWHWKMVIAVCALFCITAGNEVLADIPDREGDAATGRRTIATAFGEKHAFYWGTGIVFLSYPILNIAWIYLGYPLWFFITFWGLFFPLTAIFGLRLYKAEQDYERVHSYNWIISIAYLIVVIALAMSR